MHQFTSFRPISNTGVVENTNGISSFFSRRSSSVASEEGGEGEGDSKANEEKEILWLE